MAQINKKRFLYGIVLGLAIIIVGSFTLVVLFFIWKMPFNNYKLEVLRKDFGKSIVKFHPAESKLLTEAAEVGNWADGTYCEFLVGQFRSSSLSKEELEKIYPDDFSTAGVYFIDGNEPFDSPWYEWKEKYFKDYKPKDNETIYLVWKADYDNSPDGDIRCD